MYSHIRVENVVSIGLVRTTSMTEVLRASLIFFSIGQVPVDGNALFSAVAMSRWFIESGEHTVVSSPEVEAIAKDLRQVRFVAR